MSVETLFTTGNLLYAGATTLVLLGLAGMLLHRNVLRVLLALTVLEAGVNLFLVAAGYRPAADAPIAVNGVFPAGMVDPVPQALVLTAIVIGVGVLALGLALALQVQRHYGTLDLKELAARLHAERPHGSAAGVPVPATRNAEEGAS